MEMHPIGEMQPPDPFTQALRIRLASGSAHQDSNSGNPYPLHSVDQCLDAPTAIHPSNVKHYWTLPVEPERMAQRTQCGTSLRPKALRDVPNNSRHSYVHLFRH